MSKEHWRAMNRSQKTVCGLTASAVLVVLLLHNPIHGYQTYDLNFEGTKVVKLGFFDWRSNSALMESLASIETATFFVAVIITGGALWWWLRRSPSQTSSN